MVGISVGLDADHDNNVVENKHNKVNDRPKTTMDATTSTTELTTMALLVVGDCIISTSNALGAYIASSGGIHITTIWLYIMAAGRHQQEGDEQSDDDLESVESTVSQQQQQQKRVASILSSVAFGYLALQELSSYWRCAPKDGDDQLQSSLSSSSSSSLRTFHGVVKRAMQLSIPMTLNNFAGGIAGGAIGISPIHSFVYGWIVSFVTMALGYWIGRTGSRQLDLNKKKILESTEASAVTTTTTNEKMSSLPSRGITKVSLSSSPSSSTAAVTATNGWTAMILQLDPSLISAALFGILSISSLLDISIDRVCQT